MTDEDENVELLRFAHELADEAGSIIVPFFRTASNVANKVAEGFDPVTDADRGAETAMRRLIESRYPHHGILGEECPDKPSAGMYRWVLDPIDGTKAFIIGLPTWGTLIGLTRNGAPFLGLVDQPYTGERFWSAGSEAFCRTQRAQSSIRTRACGSLSEAILAATTPEMFQGGEAERFGALSRCVRMTRYGGDCYLYCMLAMGLIDIVAESCLKPFDILPLIPIIEAAGGMVTTWDGGNPSDGGRILATGDRNLHEAAMQALSAQG